MLPSVVCSTHAAGLIAEGHPVATAITHQHGCLHVGDDLEHTERDLLGAATNPNVGACVVVGLGCETIQGRRLARRIGERGQRVEFVGIQAAGGTARAVARGAAAVARLERELAREPRRPLPRGGLVVGIDSAAGSLADEVAAGLAAAGVRSERAGVPGPEGHVELAGRGAQLIVSLLGADQAPTGFALCPVIAVGCCSNLHRALAGDLDIGADPARDEVPRQVVELVIAAAEGAETASERRGARDLVLRRLARTM